MLARAGSPARSDKQRHRVTAAAAAPAISAPLLVAGNAHRASGALRGEGAPLPALPRALLSLSDVCTVWATQKEIVLSRSSSPGSCVVLLNKIHKEPGRRESDPLTLQQLTKHFDPVAFYFFLKYHFKYSTNVV
ncbi:hypothetical protein NDU88_005126 [Pleurodeles waltl]|uniref:Uncharacterized protein n=1 Tax=Pleurodeles waltl TaxID=8319 RepID=A0AAV7L2U4_PLEWA|nr:hypothetical protein NDU88_005126 [Pleurodeles waltl]